MIAERRAFLSRKVNQYVLSFKGKGGKSTFSRRSCIWDSVRCSSSEALGEIFEVDEYCE